MYQANGNFPFFLFFFGAAPKSGRLVIAKTADTEKNTHTRSS